MISAGKYGQALFDLATELGCTAELLDDMRAIKSAIADEPQILEILGSPAVTAQDKRDFVKEAFGDTQEILLNTLYLLCDMGEMKAFPQVLQAYSDRYDDANNICRVRLVSAVEMSDEQCGRLLVQLERSTGMSVVLEKTVDPDIIGGLVLDFPDRRIDTSLKTRLRAMQEVLTETIN